MGELYDVRKTVKGVGFMRSIRIILLGVIIYFVVSCPNIIFAESLKDLTDTFNIDTVEKEVFQRYSKAGGLLSAYLLCMAAVRDDVVLCNYLNQEEARVCNERFNSLRGFYKELIMMGTITLRAINSCMKTERDSTLKNCQELAKAFISQDTSICKASGNSECSAIITREAKACRGTEGCRDRVYYIKAVEEANIKICDKIKDESLKMLCMGDITLDENICKQCTGFERFIDLYYKDIVKGRAER